MNSEKRLNVRLSEDEHRALAEQARALGVSMSDLARHRCLEDDSRPRIITDIPTLQQIYRDQKRIGGLLNQLLRHANARRGAFPELESSANELLGRLSITTSLISDFIQEARYGGPHS